MMPDVQTQIEQLRVLLTRVADLIEALRKEVPRLK